MIRAAWGSFLADDAALSSVIIAGSGDLIAVSGTARLLYVRETVRTDRR